jgi:2-keto-4-pentenoate hydratase/2-oxohepta-3-ene-1,7-dioic acid hydratase in catechol pathway
VRIARFATPAGSVAVGAVESEAGAPLAAATVAVLTEYPMLGPAEFTGERWALPDLRLLAPIRPGKVVCVGKNYADHVREMGGDAPPERPVLFLKPSTAVIGPLDPIRLPLSAEQVDYEGELAVVIGAPATDVPRERALHHVFGYTCANDVTARDQQRIDGQWTRAKGYDTFCPLGPWIETVLDPADLAIRTELDGQVRQRSRTSLLLHDVPTLISYISHVMTLLPGDVILTGTPAGVGPMHDGQSVSVTIDGIGTLTNPVTLRK